MRNIHLISVFFKVSLYFGLSGKAKYKLMIRGGDLANLPVFSLQKRNVTDDTVILVYSP